MNVSLAGRRRVLADFTKRYICEVTVLVDLALDISLDREVSKGLSLVGKGLCDHEVLSADASITVWVLKFHGM